MCVLYTLYKSMENTYFLIVFYMCFFFFSHSNVHSTILYYLQTTNYLHFCFCFALFSNGNKTQKRREFLKIYIMRCFPRVHSIKFNIQLKSRLIYIYYDYHLLLKFSTYILLLVWYT